MLTFTIPWSALCSDNRKYLSGQFILTPQYREAKATVGLLAKVAATKAKWARAEGPLILQVEVREPDRRKRDLNWSKVVKDGITANERVWWDDSQVRAECWRFIEPPDKDRAGAVVTIAVLDDTVRCPDIRTHDPAVGRPGELSGAAAPGLQRARRVRRGSAAPDEPVGAGAGGAVGGRQPRRPARQRRAVGAVPGREGAAEAQARPVRAQAQAPRAAGGHGGAK